MYDTGPTLCNTTPEIHFGKLFWKSLAQTWSPGLKSLDLLYSSWCCFCFACAAHTVPPRFGLNISSHVRKVHPIISINSATLVVECGVVPYVSRKSAIRCCHGNPSFIVLFIACLNVWTMRSARPLDDGWCGILITTHKWLEGLIITLHTPFCNNDKNCACVQ